MIEFVVPGPPVPQGSMHVFADQSGRVHARHHPKVHAHRRTIGQVALIHMKREPMYEGALAATIEFGVVRPKTVTRDYPHTRPDIDKLVRTVFDALSGVVYKDDGQIVECVVRKRYADTPFTKIKIERIEK